MVSAIEISFFIGVPNLKYALNISLMLIVFILPMIAASSSSSSSLNPFLEYKVALASDPNAALALLPNNYIGTNSMGSKIKMASIPNSRSFTLVADGKDICLKGLKLTPCYITGAGVSLRVKPKGNGYRLKTDKKSLRNLFRADKCVLSKGNAIILDSCSKKGNYRDIWTFTPINSPDDRRGNDSSDKDSSSSSSSDANNSGANVNYGWNVGNGLGRTCYEPKNMPCVGRPFSPNSYYQQQQQYPERFTPADLLQVPKNPTNCLSQGRSAVLGHYTYGRDADGNLSPYALQTKPNCK